MTEVTDLEKPSPMEDEVLRAQRRMKMKEIKDSIIRNRPELYSPPSLTHVNEWKESLRRAEQSKSMDNERAHRSSNNFYPEQSRRHNRLEDERSASFEEYEEKDLSSSSIPRRNSFKTKIFRNGNYNDVDDPGYSSASPYYGNDPGGAKSLPGGSLNSSISSTKVIFDERIYSNKDSDSSFKGGNVEDHYFQSLKNFHSADGIEPPELKQMSDSSISKPKNAFSSEGTDTSDSFMSMLTRSFSKKLGRGGVSTPSGGTKSCSSSVSTGDSAHGSALSEGSLRSEGLEMMENSEESSSTRRSNPREDPHFLSRSVTASEFGDPDSRGTVKSKDSPPKTWFHTISNVVAGLVASGHRGSLGSRNSGSKCLCKECEHHVCSRKISWGMFFFLLLIDIITIIIMMIVFDKLQELRSIENISLASIAERRYEAQNPSSLPTESIPSLKSVTGRSFDPDKIYFSEEAKNENFGDPSYDHKEEATDERDERNIVISRTFNVFERPTERSTLSPSTSKSSSTTEAFITPSTTSLKDIITTPSFRDGSTIEYKEDNISMLNIQKEIINAKNDIYQDMNEIISNLNDEIQDLRNKIEALKRPPVFSCYRTTEHKTEGVIKYTDCNIKTPGMNPATGKFTVQTPGIYRLTFTGLFKAINGHAVNADIIKRTYSGSFDFLGRSSADTDEIGTIFANDDSIMSTNTLTVMSSLRVADEVYVTMSVESNNVDSSIYSSANPAIHFNGEWVSTN